MESVLLKPQRISAYLADETGATAIEYGLIAAGIVLALISTMPLLTNNMGNTYNEMLTYFNAVGA